MGKWQLSQGEKNRLRKKYELLDKKFPLERDKPTDTSVPLLKEIYVYGLAIIKTVSI